MKILLLLVALIIPSVACASSYDSAIYAAQKGDWADAHAQLNKVIIDNPDNADVLHDAGVAAHKLGNFGQATACFTRAAECASDGNLRFDAHFKAGNASVDNKDLQGALEQYDKALGIKPDDGYARHNRERVAQMLKEQEQKEQQQDDSSSAKAPEDRQEKDEQNENQDDKQDKQNQDKKDNGNDQPQSGDDNQQQGDGDKSQDGQKNKKEGGSDKKTQGDQRDDAERGQKETQRKEHGDKEQRRNKSTDNKERDGDHKLDKEADSEQNKGDKQQGNEHNKAPKQNETKDNLNVAAQATQEQGKDDDKLAVAGINDPWLLNILNNQELQDKAINKKLMEAKISQHGGKNGQNCW